MCSWALRGQVLDKAKPGKNPCRSAYDGHPLTRQEVQVHALQDLDITEVCFFDAFFLWGGMGVLDHVNDRSSGKGTRNIQHIPSRRSVFGKTLSRRSSKAL